MDTQRNLLEAVGKTYKTFKAFKNYKSKKKYILEPTIFSENTDIFR